MSYTSKLCNVRILLALHVVIALSIATAMGGEAKQTSAGWPLGGIAPMITVDGQLQADQDIHERMSYYGVPAISIAIIENWEVSGRYAFGIDGTVVKTDTLFQAASISKSVTSITALLLAQRGIVSLDEDVASYLKRWQLPSSGLRRGKKVTLRHLLSHRAGLGQSGFEGYPENVDVPSLTDVLSGIGTNHPPIDFVGEPGEAYQYSGGGSTVAQMALEDRAGEGLHSLAKSEIFDPIGMQSSWFHQPLGDELHMRAAHAHDRSGDSLSNGRWHVYPELAAAGLWTTPEDLARFLVAVSNSLVGRDESWLTSEMAGQAIGMYKDGEYGLGFRISGAGSEVAFSHSGANEGFRARAIMFPYLGKGAVVMTNGELGNLLIGEVLGEIAEYFSWPKATSLQSVNITKLTRDEQETLVGHYFQQGEGECAARRVEIVRRDDEDLGITYGAFSARLMPTSRSHFFVLNSSLSVSVVYGQYGGVREITLNLNEEPFATAERVLEGKCT